MEKDQKMRIGMIIDPLESLHQTMDTSLLVAAEAQRRGHSIHIATLDDLYAKNSQARARWQELFYAPETARPPHAGSSEDAPLADFDIIVMRKDPPVDEAYLAACFLLEGAGTPVVNSPSGLRLYNEKISHLSWGDHAPPTLVSRNPADITAFVTSQPEGAVCKPLNLYSGKGVLRLNTNDHDLARTIATATHDGQNFVVVQRYLPAVSEGDKRIYLVEGEAIGWMNRRPKPGEWRANIHLGATPEPVALSERDHDIINTVAIGLRPYDVPLACIDIIGDYLTEVNVTSPSGLPEINHVTGHALEGKLVDFLEKRAASNSQYSDQ